MVSDLLESGASADTTNASLDGYAPLHIAAVVGRTEMVELLLLTGAHKDALNRQGCTRLYMAVFWDHVAAALALLAAGADVNLRFFASMKPLVHAAAERGCVEHLERGD